jgi:hypothetical protein
VRKVLDAGHHVAYMDPLDKDAGREGAVGRISLPHPVSRIVVLEPPKGRRHVARGASPGESVPRQPVSPEGATAVALE